MQCAKNVFALLLKCVQIHDGAIAFFTSENVHRLIRYEKALCLIWIFHLLSPLFLAMRAENRTPAAEDDALQCVFANGAWLAALAVNLQMRGVYRVLSVTQSAIGVHKFIDLLTDSHYNLYNLHN